MYFTEKQLRIMQFIQQFRAERGISPTLEEIAENFGVTKITIYEHINQLERKGALKREKFRARSIELLVPVEEMHDRFSMPLLGRLRGDAPLETTDQARDFSLTELFPLGKNCFALQVDGDAMKKDHITHGDLVIVEKRDHVNDGEAVVVHLENGKTTIKRYYRSDKGACLKSTNGSEEEIYHDEPRIQGVVIGVVRRYE
ncbi:MAG TPA: transcriptional repressor LexA [Planctomycetota bacterium]|nr:transcriptional repressor LexA [Planctomycetota bacterium]